MKHHLLEIDLMVFQKLVIGYGSNRYHKTHSSFEIKGVLPITLCCKNATELRIKQKHVFSMFENKILWGMLYNVLHLT